MGMKILSGFAAAAIGVTLAIWLGTPAQAAAPANYLRACAEVAASNAAVEKAVFVTRRAARRTTRRTARRTVRRHY